MLLLEDDAPDDGPVLLLAEDDDAEPVLLLDEVDEEPQLSADAWSSDEDQMREAALLFADYDADVEDAWPEFSEPQPSTPPARPLTGHRATDPPSRPRAVRSAPPPEARGRERASTGLEPPSRPSRPVPQQLQAERYGRVSPSGVVPSRSLTPHKPSRTMVTPIEGRHVTQVPGRGLSQPAGRASTGRGGWPAANNARQRQEQARGDEPFNIKGYQLAKLLGRGGMGEVFLASRLSSAGVPVPCVVKTIIEHVDADLDMQEMFLDEARICSHLRHPNVVSIMDVGHTTGRLYLTLEWIDGIDGSDLIKLSAMRKKGVPFKHVLYIVREALKGLHHAHTAVGPDGQPLNIVHRDISPGNILISRQGAVKLADFGVALGRAAQNTEAQETRMGKPTYMSPEIWREKPASIQSDIYAMGVTLYELLTSQPLFEMKDSIWAVALEIASFDPKSILESDLTLPEGIENILLNSLAPDPADRYQSALEFLEDVNDFCYEMGIRLLDVHFATYIERMIEYRDRLKAERDGR